MSDRQLSPVWFICAGCQQGSAVPVWVRRRNQSVELRLVTAQHVLREGGQPNAPYAVGIQGWAPGDGYNPGTAIGLSVDRNLTPPEALPMVGSEDLAFLILPREFSAGVPPPLMPDGEFQPGTTDLTISGYIGGEDLINVHRAIVRAAPFPNWTYESLLVASASGILSPGMGTPEGGVSGGGVFHKGRYAGLYRGKYTATGQHTFIPTWRLREWCLRHAHELVDVTTNDQVTSIQHTLEQTADRKRVDPAVQAVIEAGKPNLMTLLAALTDFSAYKELHDQLHLIQLQFSNASCAVRNSPLEGDALDRFCLAMEAIDQQILPTEAIISRYTGTRGTFKACENLWLKGLRDAAQICQNMDITSGQAVAVCNRIRSVLCTHLPRINALLTENATIMDLAGLGRLFGEIGALQTLPQCLVEHFNQGQVTCQSLSALVQQQTLVHTQWQTIDVSIWLAERSLPAISGASRDSFDLQWQFVAEAVNDLIVASAVNGDVEWTVKMPQYLAAVANAQSEPGRAHLISAFDRAAVAIRRQFFKVDRSLRALAERIAELRNGLDSV